MASRHMTKMPRITSYWGNATKDFNEVSSYPGYNVTIQKKFKIANAAEDGQKRYPNRLLGT